MLDQLHRLIALGVDAERVIIGHSGDSTDLDYPREIADTGAVLGMDQFGLDEIVSVEQRVAVVAELCRLGYADRMVLSHDTNVHTDSVPLSIRSEPQWRRWDYLTVPDLVLPALQASGVSDEDITTMMTGNPARLLASPPSAP